MGEIVRISGWRYVLKVEDEVKEQCEDIENGKRGKRKSNKRAMIDLRFGRHAAVNAEQRLIRTGTRIDSFDVELLKFPVLTEVTMSFWILVPYTLSVMFRKAPIIGNEDILGGLSLYVLVVLLANDDKTFGGVTFALYSLICRHAKLPSYARISNFRRKVPSPMFEWSLKIKERLDNSRTLRKTTNISSCGYFYGDC
ncbi:hypothetical protein PHAVU_009G047300 [Phaseolus vulgaris]|uniref:Uncharacterized protein n=1 Tax=Phaseolus vulgaris TaxID=3885 RepID=V7AS25_PHAVU|nr:hypothetical protein PHAVU_009G047300g [Phaseolus vulgaris]ESW08457.1 hypothetical protein PHAVU_009G047300g [Phaseolus vulgaris]